MPERLSLTADPIIHTDILLKPPNSELAFFLREPLGGTREIWKDEESDESDCDGDATFDDDYSWFSTLLTLQYLCKHLQSQRHAAKPRLPDMPLRIPAAMRPENAPEINEPE